MKYNFCLCLSKFVECSVKSVKFGQKEIVAIFTQCMIKCCRKQNHPRRSNSFYQSEFTDFQKRWVLDRELSRHIYAVTCMHIVIRSLGPSKDQILDSNYI